MKLPFLSTSVSRTTSAGTVVAVRQTLLPQQFGVAFKPPSPTRQQFGVVFKPPGPARWECGKQGPDICTCKIGGSDCKNLVATGHCVTHTCVPQP